MFVHAFPLLRRLTGVGCCVLVAQVCGFALAPVSADIIVTKPIIRKFPSGVFCALPVTLTFNAPSDGRVTVEFKALRFVDDGFGGQQYTGQAIDNVVVATTAMHQANFGPPESGSSLNDCYTCDGVTTLAQFFYFNRFGTLPFKEVFDLNPDGRGWDMLHGAYWNNAQGAPHNVEHDSQDNFVAGCLGLGDAGPQADPYGTTTKLITGLTAGVSYTLSAWWNVDGVVCPVASPPTYLTVTVTGQGPVGVGDQPLAQTSWLGPAAPNPAHGPTRITYRLSEPGRVSLVIYDTHGRRVRGLVAAMVEAGERSAEWDGLDDDGRRVASGLYFYRLEVPGKALWGKVVTAN
jgi:hypothetical protein